MGFLKEKDSVISCDICGRVFVTVDEAHELPDIIYCRCGAELLLFPIGIHVKQAMQTTHDIIKDIDFTFDEEEFFINQLYSQLRSAIYNEAYLAAHLLKIKIEHHEKLRASR